MSLDTASPASTLSLYRIVSHCVSVLSTSVGACFSIFFYLFTEAGLMNYVQNLETATGKMATSQIAVKFCDAL